MRRGVALQGVGERNRSRGRKAGEQVSSKDFGDGAETELRVGIGSMAAAGRCFAIALDQDFAVANNHENHAGDCGLLEDGLAAERGVGQ